MDTYSQDLCDRVLSAWERGERSTAIAAIPVGWDGTDTAAC